MSVKWVVFLYLELYIYSRKNDELVAMFPSIFVLLEMLIEILETSAFE